MASAKQRAAARRNIKKAAKTAKKKRTIAYLPMRTGIALGKKSRKRRNESAAETVGNRLAHWRGCSLDRSLDKLSALRSKVVRHGWQHD